MDHVTARRLAIWLAARPQPARLADGLVHFIRTGAISQDLKIQLRKHARAPESPGQAHAARLLHYATGRSTQLTPVGPGFGHACDQMDRADLLLGHLHDQAARGSAPPRQAWPDADGPPVITAAYHDPGGQTVCLILDATTANIAMFAITAHADEREAHIREVQRSAQNLPDGSYGRRNRQAIAARETRIATRLRAIEHAYRIANERHPAPEPTGSLPYPEPAADREIELE